MVANAFSPELRRKRQVDLLSFEASLVYRVSSRTARATEGKQFKMHAQWLAFGKL